VTWEMEESSLYEKKKGGNRRRREEERKTSEIKTSKWLHFRVVSIRKGGQVKKKGNRQFERVEDKRGLGKRENTVGRL